MKIRRVKNILKPLIPWLLIYHVSLLFKSVIFIRFCYQVLASQSRQTKPRFAQSSTDKLRTCMGLTNSATDLKHPVEGVVMVLQVALILPGDTATVTNCVKGSVIAVLIMTSGKLIFFNPLNPKIKI